MPLFCCHRKSIVGCALVARSQPFFSVAFETKERERKFVWTFPNVLISTIDFHLQLDGFFSGIKIWVALLCTFYPYQHRIQFERWTCMTSSVFDGNFIDLKLTLQIKSKEIVKKNRVISDMTRRIWVWIRSDWIILGMGSCNGVLWTNGGKHRCLMLPPRQLLYYCNDTDTEYRRWHLHSHIIFKY